MKRKIIYIFPLLVIAIYLVIKAPVIVVNTPGNLVAYRAGGQIVDYQKLKNTPCSSKVIIESSHRFIENTLPAVAHARENGFEIIHVNIHITSDGKFVVFHDDELGCATDGNGKTSEHSLTELQTLDAGFGYTADAGKTYPWRGKNIKIPGLDEVILSSPEARFWLHLKKGNKAGTTALVAYLNKLPVNFKDQIVFISGEEAIASYKALIPNGRAISLNSSNACLDDYRLFGWTRFYPEACKNTVILVPPSRTENIWGWPKKFAGLSQKYESQVYLWTRHTRFKSEFDLRDSGIGIATGDIGYFQ